MQKLDKMAINDALPFQPTRGNGIWKKFENTRGFFNLSPQAHTPCIAQMPFLSSKQLQYKVITSVLHLHLLEGAAYTNYQMACMKNANSHSFS